MCYNGEKLLSYDFMMTYMVKLDAEILQQAIEQELLPLPWTNEVN